MKILPQEVKVFLEDRYRLILLQVIADMERYVKGKAPDYIVDALEGYDVEVILRPEVKLIKKLK